MKKIYVLLLLLIACSGQVNGRIPFASPSAPFTTIQSAINTATTGSVIIVPVGNYPEQVMVSKSLTIRCAVTLQCTAKRFDLWGSNITLDGFKLVGGLSYGVDVRQSNNTVRNVDISDVQYDFTLPRGQGVWSDGSIGWLTNLSVFSIGLDSPVS